MNKLILLKKRKCRFGLSLCGSLFTKTYQFSPQNSHSCVVPSHSDSGLGQETDWFCLNKYDVSRPLIGTYTLWPVPLGWSSSEPSCNVGRSPTQPREENQVLANIPSWAPSQQRACEWPSLEGFSGPSQDMPATTTQNKDELFLIGLALTAEFWANKWLLLL